MGITPLIVIAQARIADIGDTGSMGRPSGWFESLFTGMPGVETLLGLCGVALVGVAVWRGLVARQLGGQQSRGRSSVEIGGPLAAAMILFQPAWVGLGVDFVVMIFNQGATWVVDQFNG